MSISLTTNLELVAALQAERRSYASRRRLARRFDTDLEAGHADDFRRTAASDS